MNYSGFYRADDAEIEQIAEYGERRRRAADAFNEKHGTKIKMARKISLGALAAAIAITGAMIGILSIWAMMWVGFSFYDQAQGMAPWVYFEISFVWFLVFGILAVVAARMLSALLAVPVAYVFALLGAPTMLIKFVVLILKLPSAFFAAGLVVWAMLPSFIGN